MAINIVKLTILFHKNTTPYSAEYGVVFSVVTVILRRVVIS